MATEDEDPTLEQFDEMIRVGADAASVPARVAADPQERRRRRRRTAVVSAVAAVVLLAPPAGYAGWALTAPLPAPVGAVSSLNGPSTPAAVDLGLSADGAAAISIAGADDYLGPDAAGVRILNGDDEPRPIASISKLITALVVLDAHPVGASGGPTLTFGRADHALYDEYYVRDATIAEMPVGTSMSLRDALATMLVPSASNYAEAIARWAFGSVEGYRRAAQAWLSAQGLERTTVVEPTGLDPRNTSTPSDLIALGRIAEAEPTVAELAATRSLTLPGPGALVNTNHLLGQGGITGLKTGTLDESGSNLLFSAKVDVAIGRSLDVVGVVLGAESARSIDASVLGMIDRLSGGFHTTSLARAGQRIGGYETAWGSAIDVVLAEGASIQTWSDTPIEVAMDVGEPQTWTDGEVVGRVTWTAGPESVSVPIELRGDLGEPTGWWRLTHPGEIG